MKYKLILMFILGIFLISFASATATYSNWREWNASVSGDYMLVTTDVYDYTSIYRFNSTGWVTNTFNSTTSSPFTILNTSTVVDESFGVRLAFEKFKGFRMNITQPIIADNLTVIWEYVNGTNNIWFPLSMTNDTCGNLSVAGVCEISFTKPTNWAPRLNKNYGAGGHYYSGYTIRARVINATGITQDLNISKQVWFKSDEIRINTSDSYTVSTLYAVDVANGWGCITKTGTQTYHSKCDLDIRGEFNVTNGDVFSIGDMGGVNANHNTILMSNATGSKLNLGKKCGSHACQTGTLIYGNGFPGHEKYLYWYGNFTVYGGMFLRYGLGYGGFAFGTMSIDWVDTTIASYIADTLFFTTTTGNITNTNILVTTLYFYTAGLNLNGMYVNQGTIQGGGLSWVLFSNQPLIALSKYDTSPYGNNMIKIEQGTKVYFEDSYMNKSIVSTTYGSYGYMKGFLDMHNLKLKVIDTNGNPIENATIKINNSNNFSGLTVLSSRLSKPFTMYDNWASTSNISRCGNGAGTATIDCTTVLSVGDKLLRFGELDQVTAINSTWVTFERNITGSFSKESPPMNYYGRPLKVYNNATTNTNGEMLNNNKYYQLLTGMIYRGWLNESQKNITLDMFKFEISKTGYETQTFTLNVTKELGTDWDKPLSLTVVLESQPDWNYSWIPEFKILNKSKHTIFKITDTGDLAIAGNLYKNTNSPPPSANIVWHFFNFMWLDDMGNLYIKGAIYLLNLI